MSSDSSRTPFEIDSELAGLYLATQEAVRRQTSILNELHRMVGDRGEHIGRGGRKVFRLTDAEVFGKVQAREFGERLMPFEQTSLNNDLARYNELGTAIEKAAKRTAELDAEYDRRPWSRFFLVTSSDGHIHSSMFCSTCRAGTEFGWLPELSGKTEAEAVKAHGPLLCTVCYPSAPVEWTKGREKPAWCLGGSVKFDEMRTYGMRTYGTCPACGEEGVLVNTNGTTRKHKPKPKK
jgi:hypothetical protein